MSAAPEPAPGRGLILLVLLSLGWGLGWPAMKIVLAELPPLTFRALNVPAAGLSMMLLIMLMGERLRVPAGRWPALVLAAMLNISALLLGMTFSLLFITSGHAALFAYTMPLWAVIFGVLILREKLTARRAVALGLGLGGVLILLSKQFGGASASPIGAGLMIAGAVAWGLGTAVQKRVDWGMSAPALAAWQLLIGGLPFIPVALWYDSVDLTVLSPRTWLAFAYSTWVPLTFCYYAWFRIVNLYPVSVSAISILAVPVVGVVSGAVLLGEPFGPREIAATALVCSALAIVLTKPG